MDDRTREGRTGRETTREEDLGRHDDGRVRRGGDHLGGTGGGGAGVPGGSSPDEVGVAAAWCDGYTSCAGAWVPAHMSPLTVNCEMARGAHSSAVGQLQFSLNRCYGKGLALDNDFGAATERALREVQRAVGAGVDGRYGPETRSKMYHESTSGSCVRVP